MFASCKKASSIFFQAYEQSALITGISDIVVVQWSQEEFKCSPFLACFGSLTRQVKNQNISIKVNDSLVSTQDFSVNKYGYLEPFHPSSETLRKFQLRHGANTIQFQAKGVSLRAEIHLYSLSDKIIISDMDGTMTKTDVRGLYHNLKGNHYLHDGYETFVRQVVNNGYKVIWITMRSIALYQFSKKYIKKYVGSEGALFPEPEQFFPSLKKQLTKNTCNIKYNMIRMIRNLYPADINPFVGGLGNRQNDAVVYRAMGIKRDKIYLVSKESEIASLDGTTVRNFKQLFEEVNTHFPPIFDKQIKDEDHKEEKVYIDIKLSVKKMLRRGKKSLKDLNKRRKTRKRVLSDGQVH